MFQSTVGFLKWVLSVVDFDDLQGIIVRICYQLPAFSGINPVERRQDLCNGSVATQGPHVRIYVGGISPIRQQHIETGE
jgi:hypothetical protein